MAMDINSNIYGFWPYVDTIEGVSYIQLYWRKYTLGTGWLNSEAILPAIPNEYHDINTIDALADPAGNIHLVIGMKREPSDGSIEVYHCKYTVSTDSWSTIEAISSPSGPDGYNSVLPYMAFSGGPSNYMMHVVWEDYYQGQKRIMYRRYSRSSDTWNNQIIVASPNANKPTVAALSNGDVYVAWTDSTTTEEWIYYKFRNHLNGVWSSPNRVIPDSSIDHQSNPFMIADRWDNLHITFIGYSSPYPSDEYEAFYAYNNLPPLPPENLAVIQDNYHPKFKWSPYTEPSFGHYEVYKAYSYAPKNWILEAQTTDTIYTDMSVDLQPGNPQIIYYSVKSVDTLNQVSPQSSILSFHYYKENAKRVGEEPNPIAFELDQNYPNPFNAQTTIIYSLSEESDVIVEVYDIMGRKIETLAEGRQTAGIHSVIWQSQGMPSGIYLYRIITDNFVDTKRMVLLK